MLTSHSRKQVNIGLVDRPGVVGVKLWPRRERGERGTLSQAYMDERETHRDTDRLRERHTHRQTDTETDAHTLML